MIVAIAYVAIFMPDALIPDSPSQTMNYYLACGFAYVLIALIAYYAAIKTKNCVVPIINIKSKSLLVAYLSVNLVAALLNCFMISKSLHSIIEPFYFDWPINYYSLLNFMDYLLIMAGLICVYFSSKSMFNYNNNSRVSSFYNARGTK